MVGTIARRTGRKQLFPPRSGSQRSASNNTFRDYCPHPFSFRDRKSSLTPSGAVEEILMSVSGFTVEPAVPEQRLLGESAAMRSVRAQIAKISSTPSNVLITGESGTGKEIVARAIHAASPRHAQAFVPVNCGAIPEALLESQLFGHVRGAFTNAVQASAGLFVASDNGTLFLDEIGEMPFPLQVKLLRVIEDKQVWAVGATKPMPVDVRLIASTNRDLPTEVA